MAIFWVNDSIVKLNNTQDFEFCNMGLFPLAGDYVFYSANAGERVAIWIS